jgi:hypothetical protein
VSVSRTVLRVAPARTEETRFKNLQYDPLWCEGSLHKVTE